MSEDFFPVPAGIDFGNLNCVISLPKSNGIDIVLTPSSNRLIPSMVTYGETRRYSGEMAQFHQIQEFSSTATELKRLIELKYDSDERKVVESIVSVPLVKLQDGTTGVKLQGTTYRPEQLIGYLFKDLVNLVHTYNPLVKDFVITISSWWTERQRRAILSSCKIAGISCLSLLNSTTAAAIAYSMIHRDRLPTPNKKPVHVAFVDFGNSSMNVAIVDVKQGYIDVKSFTNDNTLGGSVFTTRLMEYLIQIVRNKFKVDPTMNKRTMVRFRAAVEKCKKTLTANTIVQFDTIVDNVDISLQVKRDEFNSQIGDLIDKIQAPIDEALSLSNISRNDLFAIEILGGGSRVPLVYKQLTEIFGQEPKKSLNLDECFAIGAGYMAAFLTPNMRVPLVIKDVSPYAIYAEYDNQTVEVFKKFRYIPTNKIVEIPVKRQKTIRLIENNDIIGEIDLETNESKMYKVSLRLKLTQSCTVEVVDATYKKEDNLNYNAKTTLRVDYGISPEQCEIYQNIENQLSEIDNKESKIDEIKNEIESLIFKLEDEIKSNKIECTSPFRVDEISNEIKNIRLWYGTKEFERLAIEEYKSKLESLEAISNEINKNQKNYFHFIDLKDQMINRAKNINANDFIHRLELLSRVEKFEMADMDVDNLLDELKSLESK